MLYFEVSVPCFRFMLFLRSKVIFKTHTDHSRHLTFYGLQLGMTLPHGNKSGAYRAGKERFINLAFETVGLRLELLEKYFV